MDGLKHKKTMETIRGKLSVEEVQRWIYLFIYSTFSFVINTWMVSMVSMVHGILFTEMWDTQFYLKNHKIRNQNRKKQTKQKALNNDTHPYLQ